jgi:hypothetical protein
MVADSGPFYACLGVDASLPRETKWECLTFVAPDLLQPAFGGFRRRVNSSVDMTAAVNTSRRHRATSGSGNGSALMFTVDARATERGSL